MGQKIRELMTKDPLTMDIARPLVEAARMMRDADVGDVLCMRDGKLAGIVTDRDIVVRCIAEDADPKTTPVERACSRDLTTLSPEDDSDNAVKLMGKKAIRRIPVVENGKPVGIVSLGDLAVARDRESALGGISAARANR